MAQRLGALAALAEPGFGPQHPHGGSQPYVTPVLEDLMPSFFWPPWTPDMHTVHRHGCRQTFVHIKLKINMSLKRKMAQQELKPGMEL